MRRRGAAFAGLFAALIGLTACDWFEDKTPRNIHLVVDGTAGSPIQVVVSKQFVAAPGSDGVTRVEIIRADTLIQVLPIDTIVSVEIEQRYFVQLSPLAIEQLDVGVDVDVDGRELYGDRGLILQSDPFRFLYQFNTFLTNDLDVVF